ACRSLPVCRGGTYHVLPATPVRAFAGAATIGVGVDMPEKAGSRATAMQVCKGLLTIAVYDL
ncbi:hypothetical protein ABTL98_18925, partial [Acinetobacter baumannii]